VEDLHPAGHPGRQVVGLKGRESRGITMWGNTLQLRIRGCKCMQTLCREMKQPQVCTSLYVNAAVAARSVL
jgi:hypothetical protein